MKLSCCLLACDSNTLYLDFWPVVRRAWKEIVAIDCKLVFIGTVIPPHLEGDPDVILFPPIPDIKTAFQAQTIRLLFPALLPYDGAVIISDIDLIPMNARFFHDNIRDVPDDRFLLYRPPMEEYLEVPIMFNAATPKMWAKFFNIGNYSSDEKKASVSEVRERLTLWAKECTPNGGYTGVPGKDNWCFDQRTLYKVIKANIKDVTTLQDAQTGWSRLDRYNLERENLTAEQRRRIEYNLYTDYHMLRPLSQYRTQNEEVFDLLFKSAKRIQRTSTDLRSFTFTEEDIITRDRYLELANKELKEHVSYVKMDYFHNGGQSFRWRGQEHPQMPLKDIIISGHSDYALDEKTYALYKDKVKLWFSTNVDLEAGKNDTKVTIVPLPIGLTCYLDDPILGDHKLLMQVPRNGRRDVLLYLNINIATYPVERQVVYDHFKDGKYVMIGKHNNSKEGRSSFLQDIAKSKFVLCPRGNGIDTHRLWECLYLGAIPIVRYEVGYSAFSDLPILFVKSWADVTEDFLTKQYRSMHAKQWNMHKLKVGYWLNLIKYKVRQLYPIKSVGDNKHSLTFHSHADSKQSMGEEKVGITIDNIYIIDKDSRQTQHLCSQLQAAKIGYTVIKDTSIAWCKNDIGEANRRVQVVNPHARRDKDCSESESKTASKHIEAWRHAQKQGYSNILILESSAILCQDFFSRLLPLYLQSLPQSSDIALLHAGCDQHVDRFGIMTKSGQLWYRIPQPHMRTCCSYILAKEARDKLLSTIIPFSLPIDWEMNYQNTMHNLSVHWAEPPIIKEREGRDDDHKGLLERIAHLRWSNKFNEAYDLLRQVPLSDRHFRYLDEMSIVCSYLPKEKKEGEGALQSLMDNFTKYEEDIRANQGRILSNIGVYGRSDLASKLNVLLNKSKEKVGDPGMDDATREPFNIDNVVAQEVRRLIKHFNVKRVVETGTYKGVTTEFFAKEVARVDTIEIVEENAEAARKRLKEYKHVTVWQGSSKDIMPRVLDDAKDEKGITLFYLDSHWRREWPILDELKYIAQYYKDRAIIVIDDFQVPHRSFAYDKYDGIHNNWNFIQKEAESCYTIKPFFYYNDRSTRPAFTIGKIYIVPSGAIPLQWAKEEHGNYYSTI